MGVYDYLNKYTSTALLKTALASVTAQVDKREGSVIYDTLAPLSFVSAAVISLLKQALENTDIQTAQGDWLDLVASQPPVGVYRIPSVRAQLLAIATPSTIDIPIGSRFTSAGLGFFWTVTANGVEPGTYIITCDEGGAEQSNDFGELTPESRIEGLKSFVIDDQKAPIVYGSDEESDSEFRLRIWKNIKTESYGGNFYDYQTWVFDKFKVSEFGASVDGMVFFPSTRSSSGEGGVINIFPTQQGSQGAYLPASEDVCTRLKAFLDPELTSGLGAGFAPVGHKVLVTSPSSDTFDLSVKVVLNEGDTLTDELKQLAIESLQNYFEEVRSHLVTTNGELFPNASGSAAGYKYTLASDRVSAALSGSGTIFASVPEVRRTFGSIIGPLLDVTYNPTALDCNLPVVGNIIIQEA